MGEWWDELEYRLLFESCPVSGPAPSGAALDELARRLNHSRGGIVAQWEDARQYCRGHATAASDGLKAYVDRMRLCG